VRVLVVRPGPHFSVSDVCRGWTHAFIHHGIEVIDFNYDDRLDFYGQYRIEDVKKKCPTCGQGELIQALPTAGVCRVASKGIEAACYEYWPDVVFVVSGFFIPDDTLDTMRAHGHKVVGLFTESPYEDDRQLEWASHFDAVLLNDPTNLDRFREVLDDVHYVPHAYDPAVHHPGAGDPDFSGDFGFVGTGFPSRVELLEAVNLDGLTVKIGGNWQQLGEDSPLLPYVVHPLDCCLDNAETVALYQSVTTSLNYYRREATDGGTSEGWAMGPREVELAACRTFFLRDPRGEGDALFPLMPTFTEAGEVRALLDWALANPKSRERAERQAFEAIRDRTFANHAGWLLQHLDRARSFTAVSV